VDEVYLWPELLREPTPEQRIESVESELVKVYPDRSSVPRDTWLHLIGATRHIDLLVFAGTFLAITDRTGWTLPRHAGIRGWRRTVRRRVRRWPEWRRRRR
jgi:hypothetical protein